MFNSTGKIAYFELTKPGGNKTRREIGVSPSQGVFQRPVDVVLKDMV